MFSIIVSSESTERIVILTMHSLKTEMVQVHWIKKQV